MPKIIEDSVVQALINYLVKRPYEEVYQIFPVLTTLKNAPAPVEAAEEQKEASAEAEASS